MRAFFLIVILPHVLLQEIKLPDYINHPCKRECMVGEYKICRYEFTVEWMLSNEPYCLDCLKGNYTSCLNYKCMITDGSNRLITVFNRMLPGPTIEVCEGDEIIVDLKNHLMDTTASIHWHGMHQRNTQYMDGVPHVTQCPVQPYDTFRYQFKAKESGTHWYHSHSGVQRTNGAFGSLIVRQPKKSNPHKHLYDYDRSDHVISVTDWYYEEPMTLLYRIFRNRDFDLNVTSTLLVNGFGPQTFNTVPPKRFFVEQGKRYRFRVIHSGASVCPIEVSIDNHKILIISTDGSDVKPIEVDSLYLGNGERFDFVLNAIYPVSAYTMRFTGHLDCNRSTIAALIYKNSPTKEVQLKHIKRLQNPISANCFNVGYNAPNCIGYVNMTALQPIDEKLKGVPDFKYVIVFDMPLYSYPELKGIKRSNVAVPNFNNITMINQSPPLLQDPSNTKKFCNRENSGICDPKLRFCSCVHVVEVPLNALVELLYIDKGTFSGKNFVHPIHLHGFNYRVVAQDRLGSTTSEKAVRDLDESGGILRNFNNPVVKDTVSVPDGGYTIIRFIADNPGFWLMHCHVDFHMEEGMQMIFKIGTVMPTWPTKFPTCGHSILKMKG